MDAFFTADFFSRNRAELRAQVNTDTPIIITGNGNMQRASDEPFKFVQDSNFWYLTGLCEPDLVLVIGKHDTFLIAPVLSAEREAFDGAYDFAAITAHSGITTILDERTGWQRVRTLLKSNSRVATLGAAPSFMARHRLHALPYRRRLIAKLKRLDSQVAIQDLRSNLAGMRMLKQPEELKALQAAIDVTAATLQEVAQVNTLKHAKHEYELEAAISYGFRKRGAEGHAFEPIVGAGKHATTLHHVNNNGPIDPQDLIVLDVGASVEHYAADITRTVCMKPMNKRQQAVFSAVAKVQDYALSLLKPGTMLRDYEQAVMEYMGTQLVNLQLITKPTPSAIRYYFPHATSHFLGLDTHDVGDYSKPLVPGMVLTCEPGIYIPEEGIGVRLEDDILITKTGNRNMSVACPRQLSSVQ
ncbi:MAG TPA: aminopeptidase P N-terminal domain-containing protein [Candidatus Saccharimonadia bacterium]|nr:aminopeptidase P N-terminal domain-containing protein [Candidatus Saccharimonadia bacterium]